MAKSRTSFECQACGARFARWSGQCPSCQQWNTLEQTVERSSRSELVARRPLVTRQLADIDEHDLPRLKTPLSEWDRVLGGGIVPGSVVLVGGDPGVGKSTLLMQVADAVAQQPQASVLYVSGEESLPQIGLRARRLGLSPRGMRLGAETDLDAVIAAVMEDPPALLVVDSIQSVYDPSVETAHGSVTQLRECTLRLHRVAKEREIAMLLIGHVTKEGVLAGPRVVEHLVDAVLYLEGEHLQAYRLLRSVKNRFGATSEVGVFEMRDGGLVEVPDPAALFISDRVHGASGSAVVVTAEGTRPMLAEVQALVTRTTLAMPRRMASGIDLNRALLIAAVLAKRAGASLHTFDIHINVVGGLRIEEPAADLAIALAILSSYRDVALDPSLVAIGEIGLAGELRTVSQTDLRLREAARLGYRRALVPSGTLARSEPVSGLDVAEATSIQEAARLAGVQ
jgi:DNA repair protein RadA/Sms